MIEAVNHFEKKFVKKAHENSRAHHFNSKIPIKHLFMVYTLRRKERGKSVNLNTDETNVH